MTGAPITTGELNVHWSSMERIVNEKTHHRMLIATASEEETEARQTQISIQNHKPAEYLPSGGCHLE